ncbi:MAG: twin-arginine translocation signal domain-containing protein [Acidobacteriota bacterium]
MNSRRQFLVASSAAMAAAALPKSLFAQRIGGDVFSNASLGAYTQGLLTQEHFEQAVGSTFTIFLEGELAGHLTLMAVAPAAGTSTLSGTSKVSPKAQLKRPGPTPVPAQVTTTGFHLKFNVNGPKFGQDTYLVDHGTLGRFAMFVVPGEPQQATATFNYLGDPRDWQSVIGPSQTVALPISPMQSAPLQASPALPPRMQGTAVLKTKGTQLLAPE